MSFLSRIIYGIFEYSLIQNPKTMTINIQYVHMATSEAMNTYVTEKLKAQARVSNRLSCTDRSPKRQTTIQ